MKTYNWGIIGLGKIAHKFAQDLAIIPNANLLAVASRSQEKADDFAKTYQATHAFDHYEAILNTPDLDVIYIATPHVFHQKYTLMCLEAGIPVLCEKAFAMNTEEVKSMVAASKVKNVFLMEALWTRFIPATIRLMELIKNDVIGDIKMIKADFGFHSEFNPDSRLYNRDLGGGSLLDIGIYPILFTKFLLGNPDIILATADIGETEVDHSCAMIFKYKNGTIALLDSSVTLTTPIEAIVYGTKGHIKLHSRFHHSKALSVYDEKGILKETIDIGYLGNGYGYEAEEVQRCLAAQKIESDKIPLQFSIELMEIMDEVRRQCGIVYPNHD